LVRLARIHVQVEYRFHVGFNPTLVRLAHSTAARPCNDRAAFQSHVGSISTLLSPVVRRNRLAVSIPRWFD